MGKRTTFGATWWGRRFLEVLETFGWDSRLQRGRSYARAGHVLEVAIQPGLIEAKVSGSRPKPYKVKILMTPLRPAQWKRVVAAMAQRVDLIAALLDGEMVPDMEEIFADAGVPLFPEDAHDLTTSCTCPDWANPCKHVAAVYYQVAEKLDADPLLLLELRGRERGKLLRELHEQRVGGGAVKPDDREAVNRFWTAGPAAEAVTFECRPPAQPGAILAELGSLPEVAGGEKVLRQLGEYYQVAGATARAVAKRLGL